MRRLRFGIVGCGVAGSMHALAVQALEQDAELVACVDVDPEKLRAFQARFGVADGYREYRSMLARPDLDVVCICTPSGTHGAMAVEAMRAGKHVIVEKPMDIRLDVIRSVLRVQRETGRKLAVISQHRFDPGVRAAHQAISNGWLGRIVLAQSATKWFRSQSYYDAGGWRGTWAMDGGGALMNQSIHYVDLLLWMVGPARSVFAYTATATHRVEVEDTGVAVVRFRNGALGVVEGTTSAYPGWHTDLQVFGERGSFVIQNDRLVSLKVQTRDSAVNQYGAEAREITESDLGPDGDLPPLLPETRADAGLTARGSTGDGPRLQTPAVSPAWGASDPVAVSYRAHAAQIADMVGAIREDREPLVNGVEGARPVALILAIYESARTGREFMVEDV